MANELPYFRFTVSAWQNGKIDIERNELKGLFISVCGFYWLQDCTVTLTLLKKRFINDSVLITELIDLGILKYEKRCDKIQIEFLNEQFDLLSEKRKRRQEAGSKGGNAKAKLKQKPSYKDKDNNKDNNKDKDKKDGLSFPFSSPEFIKTWDELLTLKSWKKKADVTLQKSLNMLGKYPEPIAIEMMNRTIIGNWQGLFEIKPPKGNQLAIGSGANSIDQALQVSQNVHTMIDIMYGTEQNNDHEQH